MEELLHKYWYVFFGALVLLYFVTKSKNTSPTLQQVGGSDATTLDLAHLSSADKNAQLDRQYGFASAIMNWNLQSRQVDQIIPLARIQDDTQARALANQTQLANLSFVLQQNQTQAQTDLQRLAIQKQASAQARSDWLGLIGTGLGFIAGL